ncbi:MAG TPA: hypothetical protein VMO20_04610 [Candidatus Acidoferrum sp.]|nr:hypothetical protein [Candidatus Acidoferrum sp.]
MKTNYKYILSIAALGLALPCMAQPTVVIRPPAPPTVVVSPPAPAVVVAPDSYVWDGQEYVGVIGDQYYYLGPDNAWIIMDPPRRHHFDVYERDHPDWHGHMIHNTKYRDMDRDRDRGHEHATPTRDRDDHFDHNRDHDRKGPPQ